MEKIKLHRLIIVSISIIMLFIITFLEELIGDNNLKMLLFSMVLLIPGSILCEVYDNCVKGNKTEIRVYGVAFILVLIPIIKLYNTFF